MSKIPNHVIYGNLGWQLDHFVKEGADPQYTDSISDKLFDGKRNTVWQAKDLTETSIEVQMNALASGHEFTALVIDFVQGPNGTFSFDVDHKVGGGAWTAWTTTKTPTAGHTGPFVVVKDQEAHTNTRDIRITFNNCPASPGNLKIRHLHAGIRLDLPDPEADFEPFEEFQQSNRLQPDDLTVLKGDLKGSQIILQPFFASLEGTDLANMKRFHTECYRLDLPFWYLWGDDAEPHLTYLFRFTNELWALRWSDNVVRNTEWTAIAFAEFDRTVWTDKN